MTSLLLNVSGVRVSGRVLNALLVPELGLLNSQTQF